MLGCLFFVTSFSGLDLVNNDSFVLGSGGGMSVSEERYILWVERRDQSLERAVRFHTPPLSCLPSLFIPEQLLLFFFLHTAFYLWGNLLSPPPL